MNVEVRSSVDFALCCGEEWQRAETRNNTVTISLPLYQPFFLGYQVPNEYPDKQCDETSALYSVGMISNDRANVTLRDWIYVLLRCTDLIREVTQRAPSYTHLVLSVGNLERALNRFQPRVTPTAKLQLTTCSLETSDCTFRTKLNPPYLALQQTYSGTL